MRQTKKFNTSNGTFTFIPTSGVFLSRFAGTLIARINIRGEDYRGQYYMEAVTKRLASCIQCICITICLSQRECGGLVSNSENCQYAELGYLYKFAFEAIGKRLRLLFTNSASNKIRHKILTW